MKFLIVLLLVLLPIKQMMAQTGPGGILSTGGTTALALWLDANTNVSVSGINVTSWADLSGYGNNAVPPATINRPSRITNTLNGFPVVRFDGTNTYLDAGNNASLSMTQWSYFMVGRVNTNKDFNYFFGKGDNLLENYEFLTYASPYFHTPTYFTTTARSFLNTPNPTPAVNAYSVWQYDYSAAGGRAIYLNGASIATDAENRTPQTNALTMWIGNERSTTGRVLNGDIAELIMYNSRVNSAQRIIIWNYLAAKYGLALASNDLYTMDDPANGNYDFDVAGIGREDASNLQSSSRGSGLVWVLNASGLGNNKYLFWGHDNGNLPATNTTDVPAGVQARSQRVWRFQNIGNVGNFDLRIDLSGLGPITASDLRLLVDDNNDGIFSNDTPISGATLVSGNIYQFANVNPGNLLSRFTIGTINRTQTSLPISLLNFGAKVTTSNQVKINWQTATEIDNDRFEVQRSANADTWETVAQVKGAGNSAQLLAYEATDNNPLPSISYYRLKQIDLDGTFSYSNIVGVNVLIINNLKIYPNPTDQLITVENLTTGDHQCQLFDPAGSEVSGSVRFNRISDSKMTIDLQLLPSGVYILVVDTQTFRIIKS